MVKFYTTNYTYDYPFPAVTLAYFLRYPNPYSRHVASTDTISRSFDPTTHRLTTVRLHLKRSRLPPAILKLLPKSSVGAASDGSTQSFILETSVVDVREGWMEAESRNIDWSNVLEVIERQTYRRPAATNTTNTTAQNTSPANELDFSDHTNVSVSVTLKSRIGEQLRKRRQRWGTSAPILTSDTSTSQNNEEEFSPPVKQSWFSSWSSSAIRSAVESISLQRTEKSQPKAQKGMSVVLDRLRHGGIQEVLEGMRMDREVEV